MSLIVLVLLPEMVLTPLGWLEPWQLMVQKRGLLAGSSGRVPLLFFN